MSDDEAAPRRKRIELAHEAEFCCGPLTIHPATREVTRVDGAKEVVEPRVMQVLVALARVDRAVVARDDLVQSCWDGRVVGDDAINRVISRLRRLADGIGQGSFRVETVTKVGYRLVPAVPIVPARPVSMREDALTSLFAPTATRAPDAAGVHSPTPRGTGSRPPSVDRRWLIGGGAVAFGAVVFGSAWLWQRQVPKALPADIAELVAQARVAIVQLDRSSAAQAVGLFRKVVELEPNYADGWGQLAYAYVLFGKFSPADKQSNANIRAKAAAERAQSLDPGNPYARLAIVFMHPIVGNWLTLERVTRDGLVQHPEDELMMLYLSGVYTWTGRCRESAAILTAIKAKDPPGPGPMTSLVVELWSSDQLEDADRVMDEAFQLFPLHSWVWITRFWLLTYTDRADQALTMARDAGSRPADISADLISLMFASAQAVLSSTQRDIEAAVKLSVVAAKESDPACMSSIGFNSFAGRLNEAFTLLNALFFDKPYRIGSSGPTVRIGAASVRADRNTMNLFTPPFAALRADPRFDRFCETIGLDRYWRESGSLPDYREPSAR